MKWLQHWWGTAPDYDWLLHYHRSHPVLRHADRLTSLFSIFYAVLCIGLLSAPELVKGSLQHTVVLACLILAVFIATAARIRPVGTRSTSVLFVVGADIGIATVLLCMVPSPFAILASAIFTGIGNYLASFHGAKVFVGHFCWTFVVVASLFIRSVAAGTLSVAASLTAAGAAFVILFTSSVLMHVLVAQLRQDASNAHFDPLTGLLNRRGFRSAVDTLYRNNADDALLVWAVVIDLDGFKVVNDRFGHDQGDHVLRRTAFRISAAAPTPLICARAGGEEFTIVGIGPDHSAHDCAGRILDSVYASDDHIPVAASLGVATCALTGLVEIHDTMTHLLSCADSAMYEAKKRGGNQAVFWGRIDSAGTEHRDR